MHAWTTRLALVGATLMAVTGAASAADATTPVVCGSNGCTPLPTATLQGLLTLPRALRPAAAPAAQPYLLFRIEGPDGVAHQVVYVARDGGDALLGFEGKARWRRVPVDDAKLLADAAHGRRPYPAPAVGTPHRELFAASDEPGSRRRAWLGLAALLGLGAAGIALCATVASRR
jgi:hypothetical protein